MGPRQALGQAPLEVRAAHLIIAAIHAVAAPRGPQRQNGACSEWATRISSSPHRQGLSFGEAQLRFAARRGRISILKPGKSRLPVFNLKCACFLCLSEFEEGTSSGAHSQHFQVLVGSAVAFANTSIL